MEVNEKRLIDAAWALTRAALEIPEEAVFNRANLTKAKKILQANTMAAPESVQVIVALEACLAESERSGIVPGEYVVDYAPGHQGIVYLRRVSVYEIGGELFWNFIGESFVHSARDYPPINPRKIA